MRTAGLMMNDVWAHRILNERGVETARFEQVPAEIDVFVESVVLRHHGQEQKYRPYLHVRGELRGVRLEYELPYGINEVTYSSKQGERVDAFYEFNDEQLTVLTSKGLFREDFRVPESEITDFTWELPASVDVLVLAPDPQIEGGNVPVVFTEVHDRSHLVISDENSGYDLAGHFHDLSFMPSVPVMVEEEARVARTRSDELNSLFGEEVFERETRELAIEPVTSAEPVVDEVDSRKEAIEAEIEAERERYAAERAGQDGTVENVYVQRIAKSLTDEEAEEVVIEQESPTPVPGQTASEESSLEPWTHEGDLDLGLENEAQTKAEHEQRKHSVAAAAAELEHADSGTDREY